MYLDQAIEQARMSNFELSISDEQLVQALESLEKLRPLFA